MHNLKKYQYAFIACAILFVCNFTISLAYANQFWVVHNQSKSIINDECFKIIDFINNVSDMANKGYSRYAIYSKYKNSISGYSCNYHVLSRLLFEKNYNYSLFKNGEYLVLRFAVRRLNYGFSLKSDVVHYEYFGGKVD